MPQKLYGFELGDSIAPGIFRAMDSRSGERVVVHEWVPAADEMESSKQRLEEADWAASAQVFTADGHFYLVSPSLEAAQPSLQLLRTHQLFQPQAAPLPASTPSTAPPAVILPPVSTRAAKTELQAARALPHLIDTDTAPVTLSTEPPPSPALKKPKSLFFWFGGWMIILLGWRLLLILGGDTPVVSFFVFLIFFWWYVARARRRRRT